MELLLIYQSDSIRCDLNGFNAAININISDEGIFDLNAKWELTGIYSVGSN